MSSPGLPGALNTPPFVPLQVSDGALPLLGPVALTSWNPRAEPGASGGAGLASIRRYYVGVSARPSFCSAARSLFHLTFRGINIHT